MKDFFFLHHQKPEVRITFAASQLQGERTAQEDYFVNWNDECFVLCDGVAGKPHAAAAAKLAGDTASWAYQFVRQRHAYWKDKKLLLSRIFRTTNITLWQKQREEGFEGGMATTMLVVILIDQRYYIGSAGDSSAYLIHDGSMKKLTTDDVDAEGRLTKVIGASRYGLTPFVTTGDLFEGDSLVLMTDGVSRFKDDGKCIELLNQAGQRATDLSEAAAAILERAREKGATDNMTVCFIKRIR